MDNLVFFNGSGDSLNFTYDSSLDRYNSVMNFDLNSSDTYKTIGLYMFEKVDSISMKSINNDINLFKFQLFNENRFTYNGSTYLTQSVTDIKSVNNNSLFYSKWVYGENFETKFPIGSCIKLHNNIYDFSSLQTYTVVGSKKNAIMIISSLDNFSFNNLYGGLTPSNLTISGVNSIGIYDYKRGDIDRLSTWNEQKFYDLLYDNKKLTLINGKTSSVLTVLNSSFIDRNYYKYNIDYTTYTQSDITAKITLKTDLPTLYSGGLTVDSINTRLYFNNSVPYALKPSSTFVINDSVFNTNNITVGDIPYFTGNVINTYYSVGSQVIWNKYIYECLQSYTQSLTSSISPDSGDYWTNSITYLPLRDSVVDESLLNTSIHLVSNVLIFTQSFTYSNEVTMASFAETYKSEFKKYNIDLYYENKTLNADLVYPSNYLTIDFINSNNNITNKDIIIEKVIEVKDKLYNDIDENISENKKYSIVFENIDSYGIKFLINEHIYQEETEFVYNGLDVDYIKTIDRTLRNFVNNNYYRLYSIGILISLHTTNYSGFSYLKDTIVFTTHYPNVSFDISLQMGSLSDYYVKNSIISFNDVGSYLNIKINGVDYGVKVNSTTASYFSPDIDTALQNLVDKYYDKLYGYGIYISNIRKNLYLNTKDVNTILKYSIKTNKLSTPGIDQYVIIDYKSGKSGSFIVGNEVNIDYTKGMTQNFVESGFSTGMIVSVNNTIYPFNNQEYNIISVDDYKIGLSYQGPFWSTNGATCVASSLGEYSFSSLAYSKYECPTSSVSSEFGFLAFSSDFYNPIITTDTYSSEFITLNNSNIKASIYIDEYSRFYVCGDRLSVVDALTFESYLDVEFDFVFVVRKMVYNSYNKLIYILSDNYISVFEPSSNKFLYNISFASGSDISVNDANGDVYATIFGNVYIFKYNSFLTYDYSLSITFANKIIHNFVDGNMYVTGDLVYVIDSDSKTVLKSYSVVGLNSDYIYNEPIDGSIYVWGSNLNKISSGTISTIPITNIEFNHIIYDNLSGDILISKSDDNRLTRVDLDNNIVYSSSSTYGDMVINEFDGDLYLLSTSGVFLVTDRSNGQLKYISNTADPSYIILYNPIRNSCISFAQSGKLYELSAVVETSFVSATYSSSSYENSGRYGSLSDYYVPETTTWLKTRQYLRKPRYNYTGENTMQYVWKFENDQVSDIFMYDLSGNYLTTGTSYSYTGEKPLSNPYLNRNPNMDLTKLNDSSVQQTVFDEIVNTLEYYDDTNDISILPSPIEIFLGYNSIDEGYSKSTLKMYAREDVSFEINYNLSLLNNLNFYDYGTYGVISFNVNSSQGFLLDDNNNKRGFKKGQLVMVSVSDVTNTNNKYVSYNNGMIFRIQNVFNQRMYLDYIPDVYGSTSSLVEESNIVSNYPSDGSNTFLKVTLNVIDREVLSIDLYGQTEIEDIRYKTELNNIGKNIDPSDAYIFKTYDVDEQGVDWKFLNKKRKEMLIVKNDIFSYVGSYKSIINAINYFGYNDLVLYEYYRNINVKSPDFFKLFKVEIPDIFDNSVVGWTINDFITDKNPNYEATNLFNLTYLVTDKKGNNILLYSLQDVLIKLGGLKRWLSKNIIPLTHRILDITGRTDFVSNFTFKHKSYRLDSFKVNENITPINFNINEAYLMPINSGSTVYNVVVDFKSVANKTMPVDFTLNIKTYKTYKEWNPFTTYNLDDEVIYYGVIYKSLINSNKILNPRKYENIGEWSYNTDYNSGELVNYNRYIYEYLGTQSSFNVFGTSSTITPPQTDKWLNISNWVEVDLKPVQNISEYRYIGSLTYSLTQSNVLYYTASVSNNNLIRPSLPYNFTIDSNIDPFIVVEVNCENGYGISYTTKKNYEIRGLNDLYAGVTNIEPIGPFVPIVPVTTSLP